MTIDTAKELQMNIAKEGLALLVLHPTADVQLYRESITLIGAAWGIPAKDTIASLALLDREREAILTAGENGTVAHMLPEEELPMNASGMETLDNVCGLFETAIQLESRDHREALFRLASKLMETQNLLDWIEKTPEEQELPELAES